MPSTTHARFEGQTEALEVAEAFADRIRGKTIVVTGVNRQGVGYTTVEAFASQSPARIILASRTPARTQESIDALKESYPNVEYRSIQVDLSRQTSVRAAAAEILSWEDVPAINIMVNSAAVMGIPERTITEDGIELQFATNHVGHFLFTCLLMPKLLKAAETSPKGDTRIVNVTSLSPTRARMRWSDINQEKINSTLPEEEQPHYEMHRAWGVPNPEERSYIGLEGYNQGKVANVLFGIAATQRLYEKHGILSLAVHPGIIQTELGRDFPPEVLASLRVMGESGTLKFISQGAGSSTSLVAALDPKLGPGETRDGKENQGAYLVGCQISDRAHPLAQSSEQAERLWTLSEELVKQKFAW